MAAQGIEELIDFEESKIISVAVLIGLFKQLDCLVLLAKSDMNKTKIVRRNVTFLRSLPQPIKHGQGLVSATDLCVKVTEYGLRQRVWIKRDRLFVFTHCFIRQTFHLQYFAQIPVGVIKPRVHFQRLAQLGNCFVVPPRIEKNAAEVSVDDDGEGIELQRPVHLRDCFFKLSKWR